METNNKKDRIIAFDVETPNARNDRMSSIGIAVIENGKIIKTYSTLINPETYFDRFNIYLTGITPDDAAHFPSFPEIWKTIGKIMESGILIAHNASFDMRVLSKCMNHYEIESPQYFSYACTVQMGRKCYPELPNHKLDTLCKYRSINLDHHKADSDSLACAKLYLDYIARGIKLKPFIRKYDVKELRTIRS